MIQKFRKKPVVIEAVQWNGANIEELKAWGAPVAFTSAQGKYTAELVVGTLEDGSTSQVQHIASLNDYIIRGVAGEFYPCKPAIFANTYEPEEVSEAKKQMAEALPLVLKLLNSPFFIAQAQEQGFKIDVEAIFEAFKDAAGWQSQNDLIVKL
jgi:hypothetical protein